MHNIKSRFTLITLHIHKQSSNVINTRRIYIKITEIPSAWAATLQCLSVAGVLRREQRAAEYAAPAVPAEKAAVVGVLRMDHRRLRVALRRLQHLRCQPRGQLAGAHEGKTRAPHPLPRLSSALACSVCSTCTRTRTHARTHARTCSHAKLVYCECTSRTPTRRPGQHQHTYVGGDCLTRLRPRGPGRVCMGGRSSRSGTST